MFKYELPCWPRINQFGRLCQMPTPPELIPDEQLADLIHYSCDLVGSQPAKARRIN